MALVMVQQPEAKLDKLRKRLEKSIGDKHEEVGGQVQDSRMAWHCCWFMAIMPFSKSTWEPGGRLLLKPLRSRPLVKTRTCWCT